MLKWLRRRQEAHRLAEAYREARERERDVVLTDGTTHAGRTPAHWRRVALIVARMTGKWVGLDTARRMLERGGRLAERDRLKPRRVP
jgi:hypothetical protein